MTPLENTTDWNIDDTISKKRWKSVGIRWKDLKDDEKEKVCLAYISDSQPCSIDKMKKALSIPSSSSYNIKDRLLKQHKIKPHPTLENRFVLFDFEVLRENIEKAILKTLANEYYREYLRLPFVWYHDGKNWTIAKMFKTYDALEMVSFDRRERLLRKIADDLGFDVNNQEFRDKFAKVFSTLIYRDASK